MPCCISFPAEKVYAKYGDDPGALLYLDPPYVASTRTAKSAYKYEMTLEQHEQLLADVRGFQCRVVLSGYRSDLYDTELADWRRVDINVANNAG